MDRMYYFGEEAPEGWLFRATLNDGTTFAAYELDADKDPGLVVGEAHSINGQPPRCIRWNVMADDEASWLIRLPNDALLHVCPTIVECSQLEDGTFLVRLSHRDHFKMMKDAQFLVRFGKAKARTIVEWEDVRVPVTV